MLVPHLESGASIEVVLKVQETCNLNCSYCYMYNVGNGLYKQVPKRVTLSVCEAVGEFIVEHLLRYDSRSCTIVLHGGEPMLMPPSEMQRRLDTFEKIFRERLSDDQRRRIHYTLQTNATLVSTDWVSLISRNRIHVGVSLDGDAKTNDARRIDKLGAGTHERAVEGIKLLQSAARAGEIPKPGVLCVINPGADGEAVYKYLTDELGFSWLDFLLPHANWDRVDPAQIDGTTSFLRSMYLTWKSSPRPRSHVRLINRAFNRLTSTVRERSGRDDGSTTLNHIVVIVETDGSISPEESLRQAHEGRVTAFNIRNVSSTELAESEGFGQAIAASRRLSKDCEECALIHACRSGASLGRMGDRFSSQRGFEPKSVYCETYKMMFLEISAHLSANGDVRRLRALA